MNNIERKLYRLVNLLSEEGEIVKNKKTGNVYMVKSFDPSKHDKPTPDEIEKTKAAHGGKVPTTDKPTQSAKPSTTVTQQEPKAQPNKIAAANFKTDAEKDSEKSGNNSKSQSTKRPGADDTKLKNLMPGVDTSVPTLDQNPIARQQLSMNLNKMAELVNAASTKDEKNSVDLCQVTVPGTNLYCDDNKGISRIEMPQFKGEAIPGSKADSLPKNKDNEVDGEAFFREFLKDSNISVNSGENGKGVEIPPDRLKATQKDMQAAKVLGMLDGLEKNPEDPNLTAPIYVSNDGYVLDGHHRWAAMVAYNAKNPDKPIPLRASIIDKPIDPLVGIANKFSNELGIKKKGLGNQKAPETKPVAEKKSLNLGNLLKARN
jgi:hypothetical protein